MVVEKINTAFGHYNYNISTNKAENKAQNQPVCHACPAPSFTAKTLSNPVVGTVNIRTELSTKEEKNKYNEVCSKLDRNTKKIVNTLLKNGVLLNNNSDDKSSVLDNLHKIATQPRANGLSNSGILRDAITTIAYPFLITQQFGDIPNNYRQTAVAANNMFKLNTSDVRQTSDEIDVEHSGTCVAASTEFKLARQMPAEFTRLAQELSSPQLAATKHIKLENLADNALNGVWLLNAFEIPFTLDKNYSDAKLKFAPDKNAIIRAQIQTTDKDPEERTPLDVLMQSTFMQIGSQQAYNTLTDKRGGKFNQNDKGLIEFEKTFTESVVFDKNILSVTYQTVDENARLIGYETDLDTMKKHLITALDMGENIIIGYTQTNENNIIVNGHEITIVGYKKESNGKLSFICNDTDDGISRPIVYSEDYLLPKIHHAALPKEVVEKDMNIVPNWEEGIDIFKQMRAHAA